MAGAKKNGAKRKKTDEKDQAKAQKQRKPGELSRFQKVVIIIFIVIFAGSTLAGALASVVQSQNSQNQELTVETMDESYEGTVADLEAKVAGNPDDTDSLLSLAQNCSSWGTSVLMLATTDDEVTHGNELLEKAVAYYDDYLEHEDSSSVRVSRALCLYYQGKTDEAATALEEVTTDYPDYAPGWYSLGALYEGQGKTDEAKAAYEKAVELDPDDEEGVKSSAESRLEALAESDADATNDTDDASSDDATTADDAATDDADTDDTAE